MKIIKLKLTNFRPYYGEENEIILFDRSNENKKVTLNVGPTGHGKTSISDAVMWCLFGENWTPKWKHMINELALEVSSQSGQKECKISVEMEVELEGETYIILRVGKYDNIKQICNNITSLSVRYNGVVKPDPLSFINKNFLPVKLMEYFIFDADDMLTLFERNQEKTIKDHINKIVGVESLDIMSSSLKYVKVSYENEINQIKRNSPGVPKAKLDSETRRKEIKVLAIKKLGKQINIYEQEKLILFPKGKVSSDDLKLKEILDKILKTENQIKCLNTKFEENNEIRSNLHLLFLKEIINKSTEILGATNTTQIEFDSAIDILKSTLESEYSGVIINEKQTSLIPKDIIIASSQFDTPETLMLDPGSGNKVIAIQELNKYEEKGKEVDSDFSQIVKSYGKLVDKISKLRNSLKQIGDSNKNKELKEKIDKFLGINEKIKEVNKLIEDAADKILIIDDDITRITKEYRTTKEGDIKIESIVKKINDIKNMIILTKKSKVEFLSDLLNKVNIESSNFFKGVRREDETRLHTIEVDSDYKLNIKNANGDIIDPNAINKGNTQIALMAFFFGLSRYLENKLPYIIDDPLIRLDIGHDRRLIQHLCDGDQQIIMHMIPGKEYTENTYKWVKPFINTQNWIYRNKDKNLTLNVLSSYVEKKDPNYFIEFDVDKL